MYKSWSGPSLFLPSHHISNSLITLLTLISGCFFSRDMHLIYDGMGDKIATFFQWTTTFVVSFIIAFISGWKLALATVAFCPLIILIGGTLTRVRDVYYSGFLSF